MSDDPTIQDVWDALVNADSLAISVKGEDEKFMGKVRNRIDEVLIEIEDETGIMS